MEDKHKSLKQEVDSVKERYERQKKVTDKRDFEIAEMKLAIEHF